MYCLKCGTELPDDATFCMKCGTKVTASSGAQQASTSPASVLAPSSATSLKCPSCGAPISPKFGEMVITCEYCGTSVSLGSEGWTSILKQTMLPLKIADKDLVLGQIHKIMDRGLLHRHLQEQSTLDEMTLSMVPYWVVPVSARTSVVASDVAAQVGTLATTAALFGVMGAAMDNNRGGGFAGPLLTGAMLGTVMGGGGGSGATKTYQMDENYNFPVVALKALTEYQPRNYQFALQDRMIFDVSKVPKEVKVLNGDIGEEAAKYQAKTLVDQLQSEKAHSQHHLIQQMHTDLDVADGELLHVPIWFIRYDHKGKKVVMIIDGNSGEPMNYIGL